MFRYYLLRHYGADQAIYARLCYSCLVSTKFADMSCEYSHTKSESLAEICATMAEIQHFFLRDCFLLAHHIEAIELTFNSTATK